MTALVFSGAYEAPTGTANLIFGGEAANDSGPYVPPTGTVDLAFDELASDSTGTVLLRFGDGTGGPNQDQRNGTVVGFMPAPRSNILASTFGLMSVVGTLGAPVAAANADVEINVERPLTGHNRGLYNSADDVRQQVDQDYKASDRARNQVDAAWEKATYLDVGVVQRFEPAGRAKQTHQNQWEQGTPQGQDFRTRYENAGRVWQTSPDIAYNEAAPVKKVQSVVANNGIPIRDGMDTVVWNRAPFITVGHDDEAQQGILIQSDTRVVWEQAGLAPPGNGNAPEPPEPPEPPPEPNYDADILFCALPGNVVLTPLRFGFDYCDFVKYVPALEIYTVTNSAQIVRVSDGLNIDATRVRLSTNTEDFTWDMSATIIGTDARALVETNDFSPVEVDVTINGHTWRILLDGWSLAQTALQNTGTIRGRSASMLLAAPYSIANDYTEIDQRLAQQLAAQELPLDWSLQWNIDDWLVPGSTWTYDQLTPIEAIARIAGSGAGYVQTHKTDKTLIINPHYETAPWNWAGASVDIQVPRNYVVARGSKKTPGSGVNSVFVHGTESTGVFVQAKLTGTAGDVTAPTIIRRLATQTTPARNLGIDAIARNQPQALEQIEMPVSAAYGGLMDVGTFISIGQGSGPGFTEDWRGLVRALEISAVAGRTSLEVRQNLSIERHYI